MPRYEMRYPLTQLGCFVAGISLLLGCEDKHHLRLDITGVSAVYPDADGGRAKRHVVFPAARMPQTASSVPVGDPDYIIPAHFPFLRIPMKNVSSSSRPPDFIIQSTENEYYKGDAELLLPGKTLPPLPSGVKVPIGIWLLGAERLTLPVTLTPVPPKHPGLTNVVRMSDICFNPYVAERFLDAPSEGHMAALFDLPEAFLVTGYTNTSKKWVFTQPPEEGKPPAAQPLAQSVYSEWEVVDSVTIDTTALEGRSPHAIAAMPAKSAPSHFVELKTHGADIFIRVGDAPLEDLLEIPAEHREHIDTHFELYYDLTNVDIPLTFPPITVSLPHPGPYHVPTLVGGAMIMYYPRGHNCPTALFKGAAINSAMPEEIARRYRDASRPAIPAKPSQ